MISPLGEEHKQAIKNELQNAYAMTECGGLSIVETVCRNLKQWRDGNHIERSVGSSPLVAERQFPKVQGYGEVPFLLTSLANAVSKKAVASGVAVA